MLSNRLRASSQSPTWYSKHKYNCPQMCRASHTREDLGYLRADWIYCYQSTLPVYHYYAIATKMMLITVNQNVLVKSPARPYSHNKLPCTIPTSMFLVKISISNCYFCVMVRMMLYMVRMSHKYSMLNCRTEAVPVRKHKAKHYEYNTDDRWRLIIQTAWWLVVR